LPTVSQAGRDVYIGDILDGPLPETVPVELELSSSLYAELAASLHGEPGPDVSVGRLITMMLEEVWADLQGSEADPAWFERVRARVKAAGPAK
jgi:hypothetical protein